MDTLSDYEGAAEVYFNGRLQAEAESVRVRTTSGDNEVTTMQRGFSGFADGPQKVEIEVTSAALKMGYETDFEIAVLRKAKIEIVVVNGGKRRRYAGRFTSAEFSSSATDKSSISGSFVGKAVGVV